MNLSDVILTRTSVRRYRPSPLTPLQREELGKAVRTCNQRSGLHVQLVCERPEPFALLKSYGMLRGVRNYLALAGPSNDPYLEEKCGYYGEELVLTAAAMGLGTCWVGGTYDKASCLRHLEPGESLVCVVVLGCPEEQGGREKLIALAAKRKTRTSAELARNYSGAPSWFMSGIAAVQRAPSARNRQAYQFLWRKDGTVQGNVTGQHEFSLVDLGIAKLHFALGAHGGQWSWGNGGVFQKAAEEKSCGAVVWRGTDGGQRQYLLARHNGGHWSFPKGHMEQGEKELETARREIREETGLTAEIDLGFRQTVTYYPQPGVVKDVVFFTAQAVGGQEHAQEEEIAEIGWFSFQEACSRITFASDEGVLLAAEQYLSGT